MAWFTDDAIQFFAELELNNNKEWFEANKKRYENSVKKPAEAFAAEMISRMKELDPAIDVEPKKCVFRIYRDTRFSKDKTPYKTNFGVSISSGGKTDFATPGLYFHGDAKSMGVATGCYHLEPAQLAAMRRHIIENRKEFNKLLKNKDFATKFGEIRGEKNKVLPAEFKDAAVENPYVFNKQFYMWSEHGSETLLRDDLPDFVMDHIRTAWPMNEFLVQALK
ncbi:MAG: DUF2461 domain-containing protein [Fimbriimonadaceae bacterium]|nr:MAG: DUF2461 domain-containing protein [Fimbriimonadaceae bacterium]